MPSQSKTFASICKEEAKEDSYFEDYTLSNNAEYFAQAFKYYCEDVSALETRPLTYSYLIGIVGTFDAAYEKGFYLTEDPSIIPPSILAPAASTESQTGKSRRRVSSPR
jgi:hypothetical protein